MRDEDEPTEGPAVRKRPATWFRYTDSASLGIEMAAAVAICTFAARWLENNVTHWSPWTTYIGIFIGLGAATRAIVRTARNYQRELRLADEHEAAMSSDAKRGSEQGNR